MSESQSVVRRRKEYPPRGPEDELRVKLASSLLLFNMSTSRTLLRQANLQDCREFHALIRDHLDNIRSDDFTQQMSRELSVKRYVRTLSSDAIDEMITRPIDSEFYRQMIYFRIIAYKKAKREEQAITQEYARWELENIVNISQAIYKLVRDAEDRGYLQKTIGPVRDRLQSLSHNFADVCLYLGIDHKPFIFTAGVAQNEISYKPSANEPSIGPAQGDAISAFAFIVPIICGLSLIPTYFAWSHADHEPGKPTDSDFFQLVASVPIQLLGISTAVWPIVNNLRPNRAVWIQCWTSAGISSCFTVAALPLYVFAPSAWSGGSLIFGSIVQSVLQLQLLLAIRNTKVHRD